MECDVMIYWKEGTHICTYILLHGPEFSIMNALISIIKLRGLLNLKLSVFCEVPLCIKLRKCQQYDNFREKKNVNHIRLIR
jgi:hypothetical protein